MPSATIIELTAAQQAALLGELRQVRYGHLLASHILLLLAAGKNPTEISEFLFCSRSSVYRTARAYHHGQLDWQQAAAENAQAPRLRGWQHRLRCLIKLPPRFFGWCRVRWSCATLALTIAPLTRIEVSRETVRQELKAAGYEWKRAKLKARDDDPERGRRLARIRRIIEQRRPSELILFADELDIELLAKVGYQWMLKGTQLEIPTPGKNQKHYLAGALDPWTGQIYYVLGPRKNNLLFRQLLTQLDEQFRKSYSRIYVVVDNYSIHKAKAVGQWLEQHPHFELVFLPSYCPKANPIERAFGDVHDTCTRNHTRKRLRTLLADIEQHFAQNGPWHYKLSEIYYTSEVDAALKQLNLEATLKLAA
jgi:putative transposase